MNDRLKALYKSHILTKSKDDSLFGELTEYTHLIEAYNPMCGDKYSIFMRVEEEQIVEASFHGFGCAISKASTALFTERMIGSTISDMQSLVTLFLELLNPDSDKAIASITADEELQAFAGTRDYPERLQCASLVWEEWKHLQP